MAQESDSSSQLVGSAPQQNGRTSVMGERTEARLTTRTGAARLHRRPPKSQRTTVSGGGLPPASPDRGVPDSEDTPPQVRLGATDVGAEATGGVGRGNSWHPRDCIC